jgi:hypothetical protein
MTCDVDTGTLDHSPIVRQARVPEHANGKLWVLDQSILIEGKTLCLWNAPRQSARECRNGPSVMRGL